MSKSLEPKKEKPTLKQYQDAVWAFLMEHCDVQRDGKLFVKFHASSRSNFENRVRARYKYEYHREEKRPDQARKKKERMVLEQKEMERALARLKWENELLITHPYLHKIYTVHVVARRRIYHAMVQFRKVWSYVLRIWTAFITAMKSNR